VQRVDATDLDTLLGGPFLHEDVGTSTTPMVVVSVDGPALALTQRTITALRALPAVTVAVLTDAFVPDDSVVAGFDLVVAPGEEPTGATTTGVVTDLVTGGTTEGISDLGAAVTASPQAAITLAQLLRMSADARVRDALVAESLAYSVLQGGDRFTDWLASRTRPTELDNDPDVLDVVWNGATVELVFDRPERHNAFNARLRDCLVEALRVALAVPDTRIRVSGRGPSFCSGGDLAEFGTTPDPATAHLVRSIRSPAWWVHEGRERISFHLHGACYGAGIELPAFAHRVTAAPNTQLCLPEVAFGLVPGAGGTVSIPRRIGRHRTLWLALLGTPIPAETALRWGLIDAIDDSGDLARS